MKLTSLPLICLTAALPLLSGCATARAIRLTLFNSSKAAPDGPSEPLPKADKAYPVLADQPPAAPTAAQESGSYLLPSVPRYAVTRQETLQMEPEDFSASRVSKPAQYRVLYFPGERGSNWAAEGSRETIRVADEQMVSNPFASQSRGGGNFVEGARTEPPTAREYVAPESNAAEAASRVMRPRSDETNTALSAGTFRAAEYRRARIRTDKGDVDGWVRPLGVIDADENSTRAAALALDRTAGEQLVYFPNDFGWGGFVVANPVRLSGR